MNPKEQEMMQKWMAFSTPGVNHKVLEPMTGSWRYVSKMWQTPKAKPIETSGTSEMKMVMGGRYLQQEIKGQMMGQPFEGLGFIGYNNLTKQHETTWLDNMGTAMMRGAGSFDAKTKTLKDSGQHSCPLSDDKTREFRSEWTQVDKNTMKFVMYGPDVETGKEFKQIEINYKRQ
ncbi:MAG: DUF1579 domain-containing protein [Bdellovibrionales bacterium]